MSRNLKNNFFFHLGIVVAIFILLYIFFFASLHCFTKHGEELTIPDVRGKNISAATDQLRAMKFEIYVDSTYEPALKPLVVLKQVPDSGSIVKEGRTVFLTVNMLNPPHIPMPNLVSLSYRSAVMLLHNNKLMVGDTTYKPDIAGGAILEQWFKGAPIRPGELIAQGSKVDLIIGNGLGNTDFSLADLDLPGRSVDEAMTVLNQYNLQPLFVPKDQLARITDTPSAIVVETDPPAFNPAGGVNHIKAGDFITLIIDQNPPEEDIHRNTKASPSVNKPDDQTPKKK